jgi:hypothetical protein
MRFTPVLIVYIIVLIIAAIAAREMGKCTNERREHDRIYHNK